MVFVIAVLDVSSWVVLLHKGINVGHIEGDHLPQAGDFLTQIAHRGGQQGLQDALLQDLLLFAQPAGGRHGFGHVKAVGQVTIELGAETQGQHEQGMREQKATQLCPGGKAFFDFE